MYANIYLPLYIYASRLTCIKAYKLFPLCMPAEKDIQNVHM